VSFAVIDIVRIENGKVVEHWAVQDRAAFMQQLGA
jgi:predicted ester cyclase